MSENLFQFPGEEMNLEAADSFDGLFADLGGDPAAEDPFGETASPSVPLAQQLPAQGAALQSNPVPASSPQPASPPPQDMGQPVGSEVRPQTEEPGSLPSDTDQEEASNPLLAAMDLQEAQNTRRAAQPIFAQLPVFSYSGNESPIEDPGITFEALRIAKADDFPELDDSQSVTWRVTYGKIVKTVDTPRKTKIDAFKQEIEASKAFTDALKKARDKRPRCVITPLVKMQKKGILSGTDYKGVFPTLEQARQSDKTICFIPARDGQIYERRVNPAGEFITPAGEVTFLDDIRSGFRPALPRIPYPLLEQAVSLFRCLMTAGSGASPLEALVHIYWDREKGRFFLHVPRQTVSSAQVCAVLEDEALLDSGRYLHYADLHSHNTMPARFSPQDNRDERANRVYLVVGRLDRYYPELAARVCNGGHFHPIPPELVLEPMPLASFPSTWLGQIQASRAHWEESA